MDPISERRPSGFRQFFFLFIGYLVLARVSWAFIYHLTSHPIPILWPAAGFALAAVLAWGYRVAPAILPAFLLAAVPRHSIDASLIGAGLAAMLQACAGAWLLRRFGRFPNSLSNPRDIRLFLLFAGPLSCLVLPTTEAALQFLRPHTAQHGALEFIHLWLLRWLTESVGGIVVTPLALLWIHPKPIGKSNRFQLSLFLTAILLATGLASYLVDAAEHRGLDTSFSRRALIIEHAIRQRMELYIENLYSIRQLFMASKEVSRDEFSTFARPILGRRSGIQALEWTPRITDAERGAHERATRTQGFAQYEIREFLQPGVLGRRRKATEYYPIHFIEPLATNERALGFDISSSEATRKNLIQAEKSRELALSNPITLVQETGSQIGVVGYLPLYRNDSLQGVIAGVLRMNNLIESALTGVELEKIQIQLRDPDSQDQGLFLFQQGEGHSLPGLFTRKTSFPVANQTWELSLALAPDFVISQLSQTFWLVLIGSLFSTSIAVAILLFITGRSAEVESLVIRRTAELAAANLQAQESIRIRDTFLSIASHELKTPLTPLKLQIDLLRRLEEQELRSGDPKREKLRWLLDSLGKQIDRLARLVEDMLDVSRISAGRFNLERKACDLTEITRNVTELFADELAKAGCTLHTEIPRPILGNWDPHRIEQVVINLVTNAMKYGAGKPVTVLVSETENLAILTVVDQGIGIAKEDQERVFERFERIVPSGSYGGLGLGLFITQQIVAAHGGRILVTSEPGQGSRFTVELPKQA